jgi:hypothetical protein
MAQRELRPPGAIFVIVCELVIMETAPKIPFAPGGIEWLNRSRSDLSVVVEMPEVI